MHAFFCTPLRFVLAVASLVVCAKAAQASVEITAGATKNMSCSAGVCSPTAKKAVLNVNDLTNMLAAGDVKITTGAGAVTITVESPFSWTSTSRLTLDAYFNVSFRAPVTVAGTGAVTITYNDGGSGGDLLFGDKAKLTFRDTDSSLVINGNSYTLVKKLKDLKKAIAKNPTGFFALAKNYNAQKDGTYSKAVIATVSATQTVEGLGNQIQNLTMISTKHHVLALTKENEGVIRDLGLINVNISGSNTSAAGIAGVSYGTLSNVSVSGTIAAGDEAAGLVLQNGGIITHSHAAVDVSGKFLASGGIAGVNGGLVGTSYATGSVTGDYAGGIIGDNNRGTISQSFATGTVTGRTVGGLVGILETQEKSRTLSRSYILDSYATGSVNGEYTNDYIGGLVGRNVRGTIESSYSRGLVQGDSDALGGLVGDVEADRNTNDYWDLNTSGVSDPHQGAGDFPDDPGITGLTTAQFQSGLPTGFDRNVWGHSPSINNGYPYLLANPPPQ